jgi:hypothetical protein
VGDVQGGTTKEGIHVGVMSGTLDLVQRSYAGTRIDDDVLHFEPRLPCTIDGLSFSMQFRGTPVRISLSGGRLSVAVHPEGVSRAIKVAVGDDIRELRAGDRTEFEQWTRHGISDRFERNVFASFFLRRAAVRMPAFDRFLEPGDLEALWAYVVAGEGRK